MNIIPNNCYISSILLFITAIIYQYKQNYVDFFSLSFIIVSVTSILHHERLNKWIINDTRRFLDIIAVIIFSIFLIKKYINLIECKISCLLCIFFLLIIKCNLVIVSSVPFTHSLMHYTIIILIIFIILSENIS